MSLQVPQSDKTMAQYLAQNSNRTSTFWESWMLNEDPSVVGNNPLNIKTGGSAVTQYLNQSNPTQSNGVYNFTSPQAGATATLYWLKNEGYNSILTAPNDLTAIQDIAKKTPAGFFNGSNQAGANAYAQNILNVYSQSGSGYQGRNSQLNNLANNQFATNPSTPTTTNNYTGFAGMIKSIDNLESSKIPVINISLFDLTLLLVGLAMIILAISGVVAKKAEPLIPLLATAGV